MRRIKRRQPKTWKSRARDFLVQAVLIIISVLLAFILNEYRENARENKIRNMALQEVKAEINANQAILERWRPYHEQLHAQIAETLSSDSLQAAMIHGDRIDFMTLFSQGIFRELLGKSAWSFIQQNGIKLEYNHSAALNSTYSLQDEYFRHSVEKLADLIVQRDTLKPELLRETLLIMHLLTGEIVGQGNALAVQYQTTLDLLGSR